MDFFSRKEFVSNRELYIDFKTQELIATEEFDYFPNKNCTQTYKLKQIEIVLEVYIDDYTDINREFSDLIGVLLRLKKGNTLNMPWAEQKLSRWIYSVYFDNQIDGAKAAAEKRAQEIVNLFNSRIVKN
jgi:hypothetical protein